MLVYAFDQKGNKLHYSIALIVSKLVIGNIWNNYFMLDHNSS